MSRLVFQLRCLECYPVAKERAWAIPGSPKINRPMNSLQFIGRRTRRHWSHQIHRVVVNVKPLLMLIHHWADVVVA